MDFASDERFGTARFASEAELQAAGWFSRDPAHSVFCGFFDSPCFGLRTLFYGGTADMAGILIIAGARGGKNRDFGLFNMCGGFGNTPGFMGAENMIILSPKGEEAMVARNQSADDKHEQHWNPYGLHGLPQCRINAMGNLVITSPTLIPDTKEFTENWLPLSGGANSEFFQRRAREIIEALTLSHVETDGSIDLPTLYATVNTLPGGSDAWLDRAFEMSESRFDSVRRTEEEIAQGREDSTGGFRGIIGELVKSFACLSDPLLLASVSPPFDFSMHEFCEGKKRIALYLMVPPEYLSSCGPVIKALFVNAMGHKAKAPSAPRITFWVDEAAQLGAWPLIPKLYSYGAGIGCRPVCVYQSTSQLKTTAPNGDVEIPASAALKIVFAVREMASAENFSKMSGLASFAYNDLPQQLQAAKARDQALSAMLMGGADPFTAAQEYRANAKLAAHEARVQRSLLTPDEILTLPQNRALIFADGLSGPICATRVPYYETPFMAGRYYPNPYFPPADKVRVRTNRGYRWLRVVEERVPRRYRHLPQYASGTWTRLK